MLVWAAHANLNTEQLISHKRGALFDTVSCIQDSERGVISVSEMHELLTRIHDILDKVMFKLVGDRACMLADVFNSASRQCHEVLVSQFPFLHSLQDMVSPSEACLYGHINWSLVQALKQPFMGSPQSFPPMRGCKARPKMGFHFNVPKRPVLESSGASLANRPHLESRTEAFQGGRKSTGGSVSARSTDSMKKGNHGGQHF